MFLSLPRSSRSMLNNTDHPQVILCSNAYRLSPEISEAAHSVTGRWDTLHALIPKQFPLIFCIFMIISFILSSVSNLCLPSLLSLMLCPPSFPLPLSSLWTVESTSQFSFCDIEERSDFVYPGKHRISSGSQNTPECLPITVCWLWSLDWGPAASNSRQFTQGGKK